MGVCLAGSARSGHCRVRILLIACTQRCCTKVDALAAAWGRRTYWRACRPVTGTLQLEQVGDRLRHNIQSVMHLQSWVVLLLATCFLVPVRAAFRLAYAEFAIAGFGTDEVDTVLADGLCLG